MRLLDPAELDAMDWRRTARYNIFLEAELAQYRPAPWHQPFTAWLVARKGLFVEDDHPMAVRGGKERSGCTGWPGANHGYIGVDASRHRYQR